MGITAKELARKLGLSEAAVSVALNNKSGVSTETKKRVLEAAERYGYDFTRVSARQGRAQEVCFIYYRKHGAIVNDNPFFVEISDSIQQACKERNFRLNIRYLYEEDNITRQIEDIVYADCAGIILLGTEMHREDFAPFDSVPVWVMVPHAKEICGLLLFRLVSVSLPPVVTGRKARMRLIAGRTSL